MPNLHRRLSLRRQILARDGNACFVCGQPMRFKEMDGTHDRGAEVATFEHIVEVANGGRWTVSNLAHSHRRCNMERSRLNLFVKRYGERAGSPKCKWLMPAWPALPVEISCDSGSGEEWRAAPGHEGLYEVSSLGRFRSLYFDPPRISRPSYDADGYLVAMLSRDGKRRPFTLHRLICRAFHGEPNPLHREAAHLNGDRGDCRADNLKWVSRTENEHQKRLHGTSQAGRGAKLRAADIPIIRARLANGEGATAIARDYPVSHHAIQNIARGKNWRHIPQNGGEANRPTLIRVRVEEAA